MTDSPISEQQDDVVVEETSVEQETEVVEETPAEETPEVEKTEDEDEVEAPKAQRAEHEHKPSVAYVEMVVRKRDEAGAFPTRKALKEYREAMLRKHGLPVTAAERKAYEKLQSEAKAARKAAQKEARKAAREARKAELAASKTA